MKKPVLNSKLLELAIIAVLLVPLFFINITGQHDWGGDFAHFIQQAKNLAEGKTQGDTYYILNPHYPTLAPPAYPVGFPIILMPVYVWVGVSIAAFQLHISALLWAAMLLIFYFFRQFVSMGWATVAVLIVAYNPWVLLFKGEILSDIPFLLLTMLALILYQKRKNSLKSAAYIGLTLGSAMLVRNLALVLLAAMLMDQMINILKNNTDRKSWLIFNFVLMSTGVAVYLLWSKWLLPVPKDTVEFWASLYAEQNLGQTLLSNASYYVDVFQGFFHNIHNSWDFAAQITKALLLAFGLIGIVSKMKIRPDFHEIFMWMYLATILFFPNKTQGFRYLLPLLPIAMLFIIYGLKSLKKSGKYRQWILPGFMIVTLAFQSLNGLHWLKWQNEMMEGPERPHAQQVFEFIRNHVPTDAVVVFTKPRVLGLYAQRHSWANNPQVDYPHIKTELSELGWHYLLVCEHLENQPLGQFIAENRDVITLVFDNGVFQLYQKNSLPL